MISVTVLPASVSPAGCAAAGTTPSHTAARTARPYRIVLFDFFIRCSLFCFCRKASWSARRPRLEATDVHLTGIDGHRAGFRYFHPDLAGSLDSAHRLGDHRPRNVGELAHI